MPTLDFPLPIAESGKVYAPGTFAREIRNFQRTSQGTLRTTHNRICEFTPEAYNRMYGVFHVRLNYGMRDVLLMRTGTTLVSQTGWGSTAFATIASGLSSDPNKRFADQFCTVNGKIIWCNGIDRARVYDGYTALPLGYTERPSTPTPLGPSSSGHPVFANDLGYSIPGNVGTVGDVYADSEGTLLPFQRYYAVMFEDEFGNLSPASPPSAPVVLRLERTQGYTWTNYDEYPDLGLFGTKYHPLGLLAVRLDDLTKQFWLEGIPIGPDGTVARHILATENAVYKGNALKLLYRIPDNITTSIPDNFPDSHLGAVAPDVIPIPLFSVMCPYRGGLAIAVGPRVYASQEGFPGTFLRLRYCEPDPRGGDVSALIEWAGKLYAFTETSTFAIADEGGNLFPAQVPGGTGCVAPESLKPTGFGFVMGLGQDGFFGLSAGGQIESLSLEEDNFLSRLNPAYVGQAVACWRSKNREYLCAVPEAGVPGNNLILTYDGQGWRRYDYGIRWAGLCETQDWTRRLIGVGRRIDNDADRIFVLDAEQRDYTPPSKTALYRSTWLKPDVFGRKRFVGVKIFFGIVESGQHAVTVKFYQNYRQDVLIETKTFEASAPDLDRLVKANSLATVTVGTDVVRVPRMTWKQVATRLKGVESFAFELSVAAGSRFHLHNVAFEFEYADAGEMMSRE